MLITKKTARALVVSVLCCVGAHAAETDLGRVMFTAGTTATNTSGQPWAYIFWQATDRSMLQERAFALFRKDGTATSADTFEPAGVAQMQADPAAVKLLINRGANLGENTAQLDSAINEMFSGTDLDITLPLERKIVALMLGSSLDDQSYDKLMFLARRFPTLAMSMGSALAVTIPGGTNSTFEIRSWENGTAGDVLGRVTVDPASPPLLPAPDGLVEVPDLSPLGNLNIRLRWSEPAALKRMSLLQFGYHVYRMDRDAAISFGWTTGAPPWNVFSVALAGLTNEVRKINRLPVMINTQIPTNGFYIADDNGRFQEGGVPFEDGSQYYYFIAAADLLGRPGLLSTGLLVTVCDRTPPLLPRNVTTEVVRDFDGTNATSYMRIKWRQDPAGDAGSDIAYYVFRWGSISQMQASATSALAGVIAGPIAHVSGVVFNTYTDTNFTGAITSAFYTVQSAEIVACGTNFSGNSGPTPGFIPDVSGPDVLMTNVKARIRICRTVLQALPPVIDYQTKDPANNADLICQLEGPAPNIAWVEFSYLNGTKTLADYPTANLFGRFYFAPGQTSIVLNLASYTNLNVATFYCRVGTPEGNLSSVAVNAIESVSRLSNIVYLASEVCVYGQPDPTNRVHRPGGGPTLEPGPLDFPVVDFGPIPTNTPGHKFLLHQQIAGGPLTLIGEFLVETNLFNTIVTLTNSMAGTVGCEEICLYSEEVDENGFSSGQQLIACYYSTVTPPPLPDLLPIEPSGTITNPSMSLQWFCPPPGVERFEVWVGLEDESMGSDAIATGLTTNLAPLSNPVAVEEKVVHFGVYQTGRVGQNFGTPDVPDFGITVPIQLGKRYYVQIHALDACGNRTGGQVLTFDWYPPVAGPEVPWPARPLPPVAPKFNSQMEAVFLEPHDYADVAWFNQASPAVRIGTVEQNSRLISSCHVIPSTNNPVQYLFTSDSSGEALLPVMLYRYQIPNAEFARVSGDVSQVSPLIEEIAYNFFGPGSVQVCDPFVIFLLRNERINQSPLPFEIFLLDTQPVIAGATYVYLVVQFDSTREPVRVIPLDPLTIPYP